MSNEIDAIRRLLRLQAATSGDSAAIEQALAELDRLEKALNPAGGPMATTAVLNDAEYVLLGFRIAREHREYSRQMPNGEWAIIAARRVVGTLREWGYIAPVAGLTVDEAEECLVEHLAQYGADWSAKARSRLHARLTAAIHAKQVQ